MKINIYIVILLICFCSVGHAQTIDSFRDNQPEKLFIHKNASVLLTGEYLYFSIYNLQATNNLPSKLSKIVYIQVINKENNIVLETKIRLINSMGQGDFFLPTSLKTGPYKIIAYTNWMLNNQLKTYNQSDIIIINPYHAEQIQSYSDIKEIDSVTPIKQSKLIIVKTNKPVYNKREKVDITLNTQFKESDLLKFSLSVRKIDKLDQVFKPKDNINSFLNNNKENLKVPLKYAPENTGFSLEGKITNKKTNLPESFKDVAISVVNKTPYVKLTKSQFDGNFNVSFNSYLGGDEALIQVLKQDNFTPNDAKITIIEKPLPKLTKLNFPEFKIASTLKKTIENRSVYNQIESNYFSVKPDSIITPTPKKPFYQKESAVVFKLDDYKRFATLRETFIEVVDPVFVRKSKGEYTFYIKSTKDDFLYKHLKPLVLLDGIVVQDFEGLLALNAYQVDAIWVIHKKITLEARDYKGVIAIETKNQDIDFKNLIPHLTVYPLKKPALPKKYFRQVYNEKNFEKTKRIPDYRVQLMWQPRIYLKDKEIKIPVYTSDVAGTYKIEIRGFSQSGKPVKAISYFKVN